MSASVEVIAAYVPLLVRDRLERQSSGLAQQEMDRREGAILFVDISGFTILTERLAVKGTIGAEELTAALNAYFDRLIEQIAAHGGDVVKMAGDALIAVWPVVEEGTLAEATLRAATCGLVVGATLQNYEVAEGIRLTSKVGIGAGEVVAMFVGGLHDRWELLLAGSPLVQMGQAEHNAKPGEVVLSKEAWDLVERDCIGEPVGDGLFRLRQARAIVARALASPPVTPEIETRLRTLIPAAIRTRLDAGQTEWLGELRRLTVLFVNLPPTDCDRPDALERAQAIVREVQVGLYHHEGSLNKLSVDDKGTTAVAALGLPPLAHRDDPRRAVQAALAIFERLRAIGVECSIGVASGRVYCGEIGNARRREYTIIGRVVNLAARLMQAAHFDQSGILCDEETARHNRTCFHFEALPPRLLKNIEGTVALFRPMGAIEDCHERRGIIGRQAELATLARRLEAVRGGQGALVVLEGEPGIGKSQLLGDLVARAEAQGVASHVGSADAIQRSTPYHAWRPVFASLFGEVEGEEAEARLARVEGWLGDDGELAPLLNVVLPLDLPETDRTTHIIGQARADSTNDLLLGLLKRASARKPTVLVVDDAHWMDSASWALTLRLAKELGQTLLVVASRPKTTVLLEQHQALLQVADDILQLNHLSTSEAVALACQRLGVDALPREAEDLILQKAQGNPLYCEELSFALRDTGLLTIEGGHCRIRPGVDLASVGIPDSVEGIINDRVDRLAPSQQMALKVASVIGRLFSLRLLQDVYPIEPERHEVPLHLDSLSRTELIQPDEPEPDLTYLFRHVITRDVVYDLLTFAHRRRLHHDVAEWYERLLGGELSSSYPLLAYHWAMAGDDARAIDYLEKAGEQALRSGAYQEAVDFLKRAVALRDREGHQVALDPSRVARWEYWLGEAHLSLGHLVQSREHAGKALELLGRPVPSKVRLPLSYLSQLGLQLARRIRPGNHPEPASSALRLASSAYGLVGQLCYFDQDRAIGVYSALRSLNLAESGGHSPELARALAVMCVASSLIPAPMLAEVYRRRAFEVVNRLDDVPARAWVLQLTGMYDLGIGRWDRAFESLVEAVAINRRLGDWRRWEESSGELGRLRMDLGHYDEAASFFREFGEEARRRGHDQSIAWSFHGRSRALIRQGRFDEAWDLLEQSLALPHEALGIGDLILRGGLLAQVHVGRREWLAARKVADEVSALIQSSPMVAYSLEGYAGVAEAYLALWEAGEGENLRKVASWAIARLARLAWVFPVGQSRAWLCRATAHRLLGQPRRARWAWRRALKIAERMELPYEQALALWQSAGSLARDHPERSTRLDRAWTIFRRIGAVPLSADQAGEPVVP
jgi:class 3 adenylate cyclase/tetratricopeptide (TPR) repeat protein